MVIPASVSFLSAITDHKRLFEIGIDISDKNSQIINCTQPPGREARHSAIIPGVAMNAMIDFSKEPNRADVHKLLPAHDARALTMGGSVANIILDGKTYTLRITRAGKLILTK